MYDVMTQTRVKRPVFSDPEMWSKKIRVESGQTGQVDFTVHEGGLHEMLVH